jgi:hypothetical protein
MESYKNNWVNGRLANLYGEALSSLTEVSDIQKSDAKLIKDLKQNSDNDSTIEFLFDAFNVGRKAMRFSKYAAPGS